MTSKATPNGLDPEGSAKANGGTGITPIDRLRELEALFLNGPSLASEAKGFSTETLLDVLMVLFNECSSSSLRKEKTVTEFIDVGKNPNVVCQAPLIGQGPVIPHVPRHHYPLEH